MTIQVEISDFLGDFSVEDATIAQIQQLEDYILKANRQADNVNKQGVGTYLVEDEVYDEMVSKLRQVKPDAPILLDIWEEGVLEPEGEEDYWLQEHPMKSILTVKDLDYPEYTKYCQKVLTEAAEADKNKKLPFIMETKLNGHGIRLIYNNGQFIKATSRARNSNGRDLTKQLKVVLAKDNLLEIPDLEDTGIVELRAELLVNFENYEKAKGYVKDLVSPLFAVASMSREKGTEAEWSLLSVVPYRIYIEDVEFESREEEFNYLQDIGFTVPLYTTIELSVNDLEDKNTILSEIDSFYDFIYDLEDPYEFFTDGIVLEINDTYYFTQLSGDVKYDYANVALKVGKWEQNQYKGYVQMVYWSQGKDKLSPVAIVAEEPEVIEFVVDGIPYKGLKSLMEEVEISELEGNLLDYVTNYKSLGVPTASGAKVKRVPLYEPANLFILDVKPGNRLHFKFGGEAGVLPVDDTGRLLTELKSLEIRGEDFETVEEE